MTAPEAISSRVGTRLSVVVICGGPGPEHAVSLKSGRAIAAAVRRRGHRTTICRVSTSGAWRTKGRSGLAAAIGALQTADVAIPALHGRWGEEGAVQGLLETIGVPYVGSGVLASATCMDKARTKTVLAAAGIPVAAGRVVRAPLSSADIRELVAALGLPLFVKPMRGGSSYGVSRVVRASELRAAVATASTYDASVLVEPEVRGREIDVGVLGGANGSCSISPALEIRPDPLQPFFSTAAKYASSRTQFLVPAPIDAVLAHDLDDLARRSFKVLGCAGLARVDFLVDHALGPIVNEVNTFPGFTQRSQFPLMWAVAGMCFDDLVESLIETAVGHALAARTA